MRAERARTEGSTGPKDLSIHDVKPISNEQAYKEWQEYLQDEKAEASFTETGALWMVGKSKKVNSSQPKILHLELEPRNPTLHPKP